MDRKEKDYNKELTVNSAADTADGEKVFADTVADETAANEDITAEIDGFSDIADGETDDVDEIIDVITSDDDEVEDEDIREALIESDEEDLNEVIESPYAIDVAIALEDFSDRELLEFYEKVDDEHMAQTLEQMDEDLAQRFVALLDYKQLISIFGYMSNDDIADILGEMPIYRRKDLLRMMKSKDNIEIQSLLLYGEDTAGGIMTTEYIAISRDTTVKETMEIIKSIGPRTEVIDSIYVLNGLKELVGVADLREILSADDETPLSEIMDDNIISVSPEMDQEEVSQIVAKYDLKSVPVLNRKGSLLGIITVDDIIDVLVEEQTEDILRMGGASDSEDFDEPVLKSVAKRLPWLLVLLALGMLVSSVVGIFEKVVAKLPAVVCFQSLILGMAGNAGTQSLAVTIRALTNEDLTFKEKLGLVSKEGRVALSNGFILAVVALIVLGLYIYMFKMPNIQSAFAVSACIGISLIIAMFISGIMGTTIPMFFKGIGVDPAVASGPLITTVNDLVAVITYYGLSGIMLIKILGL